MNIKSAFGVVVATAMVAMASVSCSFDDTSIWDEINGIKQELADLRESVATELNALKELLDGAITIKEIKKQSDGSTTLTLSDGSKINIYPKGDTVPADLVTVMEKDGVYYWAMFDGIGNKQPIYDSNSNMIPVADVAPQTQVNEETNAIEVSFDGGKTWITTGYSQSAADSIISDIEVVYSEWQVDGDGNPLALYCMLTLNDGSVVKVGMQNGKLITASDMLFVAYGATETFYVDTDDAVDFLMQTPRGWECDVTHKIKEGKMALEFHAPTYEAIESGEALATGVAKLMVVFSNGSSAIASIKVSTNPATVHFTTEGVYVKVGYGTSYIVGGLMTKNGFANGFDSLLNVVNTHLSGTESTQVEDIAFMEESVKFVPFADIYSTALKAGNEYVFWYASPLTDAEGGMYVTARDICSVPYKHIAPTFLVTASNFYDVTINFKATGVDSDHKYMLGYTPTAEFDAAAIVQKYVDYPDYFNASYTTEAHNGSFLELFDPNVSYLEPNTEYTAWYINESSLSGLIEENLISWNFKTKGFEAGGSLEVSVSDVVVEYTSIEMMLNTTGHIAIYYNMMPSYKATAYPTDELVINMLNTTGSHVYGSDAARAYLDGAEAGEPVTLFAVAVDAEGKYGKILKAEYTTKPFVYNDLSLSLELQDYKIDDTKIAVTCEGASKYLYIYEQVGSETWTKVYGGTRNKAGEYIIANPDDSRICDTSKEEYALQDGKIVLRGLEADKEYAVVVMAVDAEGVHSKPQAVYFNPIANIGTVVTRDNEHWAVGKPTIEILEYEDNPHLFLNFAWATTPGERTTVYTAALFRANLINDELGTNIDTNEKLIAEIIKVCDTGRMDEQGKSFVWNESGLYTREWTEWEDTDNDNYLEEVHKSETKPYCYHFFPYGASGQTFIYTTWVCEDGNFHEPFAIDPITGEEVSLW